MFFRKSKKPKIDSAGEHAATTVGDGPAPPTQLGAVELRRTVAAGALGFATTADLEPGFGLIGQDRALKAIEFGVNIKARDFNVFVMGPPASGKTTAVKAYLAKKAAEAATPSDWVYVNNFDDANRPRALALPAGRAKSLARSMAIAVDELRTTLPAIFEGEDHQARRRAVDEEFRSGHESRLEALNHKAAAQNIAILRTPMGFTMAPMHEGKIVKPDVFNQLPEAMRSEVESRVGALQKELAELLSEMPKADKARRKRISEINEEASLAAVAAALEDVKAEFADLAHVMGFVAAAEVDLVRNAGLFLTAGGGENAIINEPIEASRDPRFRRYLVNVMAANGEGRTGAPIYEEENPTFSNIAGRVEHLAQMGALVTDFLLIKPGALHRANGGYLLVEARKLLQSPFAWEVLKRAIKAGKIRIEPPADVGALISTQTLECEPIPLDIKVILLGDPELYYLLNRLDPDFSRLFKVQADFDDTIDRNADNDRAYARLVTAILTEHKLKPMDASGVARIIEEGARMADDREKLSIEIGRISDIVREADYWAGAAQRQTITRADVARAVEEHVQRSDRLRDRTQEFIERGVVLVDTTASKIGQINGLSVSELGDFAFGRPSRITARVRMGQGRVTDIEREAKLGGPLHSKGVMILWGYLAGRFAGDVPLALAASLVFEQSYGGIDGDSASVAELYALLSALAEVPIHQGIAVTGSVNQWGEVQAIGGVNEKIEGFFDVCKARGLDGKQGVVIPRANVQHLMLREDVVNAVAEGRFSVHAIASIDEGVAILTGMKAGERGVGGAFSEGSLNRLVEERLRKFAAQARAFATPAADDPENAKAKL